MRHLAAAMAVLALVHPAHAEFTIAGAGAPAVEIGQAGPITLNPEQLAPPRPMHRPWIVQRRQLPPKAPAGARGFGHQVPLAFAIRQIVPPTVKVMLADDVDPNELVDWDGGRAWVATLQAAVRPLNLRVSVTPMRVSITRT